MKKLGTDNYIRPMVTLTESIQNKEGIQQYLKDYDEVKREDVAYLQMNTHVRYISWDKRNNCELFRLGGFIKKIEKDYLVLAGKGSRLFSVQTKTYDNNNNVIHITRFFKRKDTEELINEKVQESIDISKQIIEEQAEMIEKLKKENSKLKKELNKLKK